MITVTESAIEFIHHSIKEGSIESELGLRVAIKEASDGGYDYGIGFDEKRENDIVVSVGRGMIDEGSTSESINIFINEELRDYLEDSTLDYVEMDSGEMNLIVLNPNDPTYNPPSKKNKKSQRRCSEWHLCELPTSGIKMTITI